MKVLKPDWISHNGMPICSIDIHPDGSRVATGGQGEDSGRIVIWNMAPVVSEKAETDENVPRMLCQLDNHLACVNCVRWSTSGKYLASGGDDKLVMVWTISKSSGNSVFGGGNKVNLEGWRCVYTLRGHHGDVLDMAWSPNDTYLATCSVDNTIIVWSSNNLPEVVTVLKGHTGLVKGVSWDPVGKYLSSQSDDRSVRIWRTGDWRQEAVITHPFEKCTGTTLVLRLGWSPDGQYLVTAHAMNGTVPTAQIVDRDGWTHDKDFVGHRMAVTCVRFSSFIMEHERKGKASRSCACAIGSRDRSVSIWVTSLTRPVIVLEELFASPVLDLSWGPRGLSCMACSGDGTTAYLEFTHHEIGTPITDTDKGLLFEKLYGKSHVEAETGRLAVVENPELLAGPPPPPSTPTQQGVQPNNTTPSPVSSSGGLSSSAQRSAISRQIETRTKDGKRRITPVYIPTNPDQSEEVIPFGSDSISFSSMSSLTSKSRILIEKRDLEILSTNVTSNHAPPSTTPTTPAVQPPSSVQPPPSTLISPVKQVSSSPHASVTLPKPIQQPVLPNSPAEGGFSTLVTAADRVETKRKRNGNTAALSLGSRQNNKRVALGANMTAGASTSSCPNCHGRPTLPPLSFNPSQSVKLSGGGCVVRVENGALKGPHCVLSSVKYFTLPSDNKPKWEIALGGEVVGCGGNTEVVGVACSDKTLHLLSTGHGEHILGVVALPGLPSLLTCTTRHLVIVTSDASLSLWSIESGRGTKALISNQSIASIISPHEGGDVKMKECFVSEEGEPMLALSTGKAYMYSLIHNTWFLLGDSGDGVVQNAFQSYKTNLRGSQAPGVHLPLKKIQSAAFNGVSVGGNRSNVFCGSELGQLCTLTYLDSQLSSARQLNSKLEYKFWLLALVRFLLQQGMERRLRSLCEDLLGPRHSGSLLETWPPQILGLPKHGLLREVLNEMSSNIKAQRIYMEFKDQLDNIKSN